MTDTSTPDPVGAYLDEVRRDYEAANAFGGSPVIPRLLAALDAVRALHKQATTWSAALEGGRFDYCSTCSGHPTWPCPEMEAISAALLGKGEML